MSLSISREKGRKGRKKGGSLASLGKENIWTQKIRRMRTRGRKGKKKLSRDLRLKSTKKGLYHHWGRVASTGKEKREREFLYHEGVSLKRGTPIAIRRSRAVLFLGEGGKKRGKGKTFYCLVISQRKNS